MILYNAPMQLIIFGFDGVLIDRQRAVNKLEWEYLSEYGMKMTLPAFTKRFSGETAYSIVRYLKEEDNIVFPKDLRKFAREIDDIVFVGLLRQRIKTFKGVKKVLQNLPLKKCITSNCSLEILHALLSMSTLASYFKNNVFSADMLEKPKPDPALFLYAAQSMGIEPKHCLVVEGSAVGVKAAIAAGMRAWGFLGGSHVTSLTEAQLLNAGAEHVFTKMEKLSEHVFTQMEKLVKILKEKSENFC